MLNKTSLLRVRRSQVSNAFRGRNPFLTRDGAAEPRGHAHDSGCYRHRQHAAKPKQRSRRKMGVVVTGDSELRGEGMASRLLMTLHVVVSPPHRLGGVPHGTRVIAPIAGGSFEGPRLRGRVLPGGSDWTLLRSDGVLELDLRITLEADDGALIYMNSFGLRHGPPEVLAALARGDSVDPAQYYFRTAPRFEASAPQYAYLNRLVAISSGDRRASGPIYTVEEIL